MNTFTVSFSIDTQIKEVEREIRMRQEVYPRQVASGKMKQGQAEYLVRCMQAVLETLQGVKNGTTK